MGALAWVFLATTLLMAWVAWRTESSAKRAAADAAVLDKWHWDRHRETADELTRLEQPERVGRLLEVNARLRRDLAQCIDDRVRAAKAVTEAIKALQTGVRSGALIGEK